jgi:hypothetical protein
MGSEVIFRGHSISIRTNSLQCPLKMTSDPIYG